MIKKVAIKNFQIHKDTVLEFTEGMNVIAGSSDNGKSSIIRAIRWVLMNRPTGFAFHTHGAKDDTAVCLVFGDNENVTRFKGEKNTGGYQYKGNTFAALRTDVPPEIGQVLNMEQINIQSQHDPYFLLQDSPGEVAKKLNVVAGLGIIGDTIKNANAVVRQRKDAVGILVQQETGYKADFYKLSWTYTEGDNAFQLRLEYNELGKVNDDISTLEQLLYDYGQCSTTIACIKPKIEGWKAELEAIKQEFDEYQRVGVDIDALKSAYYTMDITKHKLEVANKVVRMKPSLEIVINVFEELLEVRKQTQELLPLINEYARCQSSIKHCYSDIEKGRKKFEEFKQAHPVCPTCNRPWEDK